MQRANRIIITLPLHHCHCPQTVEFSHCNKLQTMLHLAAKNKNNISLMFVSSIRRIIPIYSNFFENSTIITLQQNTSIEQGSASSLLVFFRKLQKKTSTLSICRYWTKAMGIQSVVGSVQLFNLL